MRTVLHWNWRFFNVKWRSFSRKWKISCVETDDVCAGRGPLAEVVSQWVTMWLRTVGVGSEGVLWSYRIAKITSQSEGVPPGWHYLTYIYLRTTILVWRYSPCRLYIAASNCDHLIFNAAITLCPRDHIVSPQQMLPPLWAQRGVPHATDGDCGRRIGLCKRIYTLRFHYRYFKS